MALLAAWFSECSDSCIEHSAVSLLQPVKMEVKHLSGKQVPANGGTLKQVIKLSALQKLQVCSCLVLVLGSVSSC